MEIRNFQLFGLRNGTHKYLTVAQKELKRAWENKSFLQR